MKPSVEVSDQEACLRAGYKTKNAKQLGLQLLDQTRPMIEARQQAMTKKAEFSQERLLKEFLRLGLPNTGNYAEWALIRKIKSQPKLIENGRT